VQEYIDKYTGLVEQLIAYGRNTDPLYFAMRFVDGLRADIRAAVHLQRPTTLDTACVLALLQEELVDPTRRRDVRRPEPFTFAKTAPRPMPLPPPPPRHERQDKPVAAGAPLVERRGRGIDTKLATLRDYRRARGLCIHCGEKWSRDHKCAETIQLHVLQEFWDICHTEECSDMASVHEEEIQQCLAISLAATGGSPAVQAIQFMGIVQGIPARILIDSGSTHTFVSESLAMQLSGITDFSPALHVTVADGSQLMCAKHIEQLQWSVQQCQFTSPAKILPLSSYELIVGMDWLASRSPMQVDWQHKWLLIPYEQTHQLLQGELTTLPPGSVIHISVGLSDDVVACQDPVPPEIAALLTEFQSVFEPPSGYPPARDCDHSIPLIPGASPFSIRPYRYPPMIKDEIERQVSKMLQSGIIQPSSSPFSSSVLLVKKKDGTFRFCVDFRQLNALTVKAKYPVPVIEELLDELTHASWFSCLDLTAGYHQIRLKEGEEFKTAFQTHSGHYEFRVMAFGLTGAPATFLHAMNTTLRSLLRKCVLVFFDDILIFSRSYEEHVEHVRLVLQLLQRDHWQVKMSKCHFAQRQLRYLGHVISEAGVATDPDKINAVIQWPVPQTIKELRSFLGLAGYYRRFVKHFGLISRPLTALLRKGVVFIWTDQQQDAFIALKQALTSAPVLALPDFSCPFVVETDASGAGIGAVLTQGGHPIAFLSKALGPRSQGLSTYEKEYMAILLALEHWRSYLQHAEFQIVTDHRSLVQLTEQRLHTPWQQKVFTKLIGLQYKIIYRKGADNGAADALSRCPIAHLSTVSVCQPQWLDEVVSSYTADARAKEMLSKLALTSDAVPHFTLRDGVIRYKNRIWVGNDIGLQTKLITAVHASAVGGHSGVAVTYRRLKQLFAWTGMKSAVQSFVSACVICQQAKPDRTKLPGLLQPLPVPDHAWSVISMDFIEGLPSSGGFTCILVVVDLFSKYAHFLALKHPFTARSVAQVFLSQVYRLHGLPQAIVSDRDKVFTSNFWRELFQLAGVELRMSTAYHPQSDGQTERVNQCVETFLRCFVHACQQKWRQWLDQAEFWYMKDRKRRPEGGGEWEPQISFEIFSRCPKITVKHKHVQN